MPLQKSFSEQNGPVRNRPRWHKSKSHSAAAPHHAQAAPSRPLEPVSEVTKNKLNAFNFRPNPNLQESSDPFKSCSKDSNDAGNTVKRDEKPQEAKPEPRDSPILPVPSTSVSTPTSRLAWQDLIGGTETKVEEDDPSPNDKIQWNTKQQPKYGMSPMPRRRGNKRARSSSPASSPAPSSKATTPAVNVKSLSQALKSPRADPAIELWDRFSLSGSIAAATPLGTTNPALAQIMMSSSPQPSRVQNSAYADVGLRRAISCGTHWPKRRRVDRVGTDMPPRDHPAIDESPSGNSKSSMVNALLKMKSVTSDTGRSTAVQAQRDALKSPSPRKKQQDRASRRLGSPEPRTAQLGDETVALPETTTIGRGTAASDLIESSSDYGDDDFDDDTLMSLDVDINPALSKQVPLPQPQENDTIQTEGRALPAQDLSSDDEFGDGVDDDLLAVAEGLVSQIDYACDRKQDTTLAKFVTPTKPEVASIQREDYEQDSYGDDFGDDFGGDFDFEAAEIAATQSVRQTNGAVPLVRRL
ncbi:hypothetical protein F5Y18DRAFT_134578 [Xylariaceae sp. FL1019]|nr:hypothetical protein F5Y18DRAFT_134578 [Xylariaceae sp. FL1019]